MIMQVISRVKLGVFNRDGANVMSMVTESKCTMQPGWTAPEFQKEAANAVTAPMVIITRMLKTTNPELLAQVRNEWAKLKVEYFRSQKVKTPLELVKAWTEYDTNMFGSKLKFWGDDKQAHVAYEECGCWEVVEKICTSEAEKECMADGWSEMTQAIAKEFGFTGQEKIGSTPEEAPCTITFTRK